MSKAAGLIAPSMTPYARAQLQIHLCVVLWGFTAVLGRAITLPALPLVLWRMLTVTVLLLLIPRVLRALRDMPWRLRGTYAAIGLVVATHWVTFYASIKHSNASVAATCIALAPVFLAFIEPWVQRTRVDGRDILLGLLVVPGVWLVGGSLPQGMMVGLLLGVASAIFVSFFAALNKLYVHRADPLAVTCLELGAGTVALLLVAPLVPHEGAAIPMPGLRDASLLLVLSVVCTLVPFTLSLVALRHLSAFTAQLVVSLEPVYAIILAALLLGETRELSLRFYLGVLVILSAVLVHPIVRVLGRRRALERTPG